MYGTFGQLNVSMWSGVGACFMTTICYAAMQHTSTSKCKSSKIAQTTGACRSEGVSTEAVAGRQHARSMNELAS